MKMQSQKLWVIQQLKDKGFVSRNEALKNFISRLGALIDILKKEGYEFDTEYVKENGGKNYYYRLKKRPKQQKVIVENGTARIIYV